MRIIVELPSWVLVYIALSLPVTVTWYATRISLLGRRVVALLNRFKAAVGASFRCRLRRILRRLLNEEDSSGDGAAV